MDLSFLPLLYESVVSPENLLLGEQGRMRLGGGGLQEEGELAKISRLPPAQAEAHFASAAE